MAEVITRLKVDNSGYDQKIKSAQRSLDQFGLKGTEVGQKLSGLTQMLNVNIGALSKLSVGLAAAAGAIKVAGDAFKQNEVVMDEWGRVTESSKALYDGFLNAINTGSIKGYISNIDQIVSAAREAYDALDELSTFNAFNQINTEKARTELTDALAGYRTGESTKEDVQAAAAEMKKQLGERQKLEKEAYEKSVKELAAKRGVDPNLLMKAMSGSYGDYNKIKNTELTGSRWVTKSAGMGGSYSYEEKFAANEVEKLGDALRKLTDEELKNLQALGAQAQRTATEAAQVDKQTSRVLSQEVKKSGGKSSHRTKSTNTTTPKEVYTPLEGSIDYQQQLVAELQKQWEAAADEPSREKIKAQLDEAKAVLDQMTGNVKELKEEMKNTFEFGSMDHLNQILRDAQSNLSSLKIGSEEWAEALEDVKIASDAVAAAQKKIGGKAEEAGSDASAAWQMAATAVSEVGSALQGIDVPAVKIAAMIAQAIANVALGAGKAISAPDATASGYAWIGMAATAAAEMVGIISAIKSSTEYHADGGFIGGPRGTDITPMWGTPGELVLNRAQQNNLAGQLAGASYGGEMTLRTEISGENLAIVLDNNNRRRGRSKSVR